VTSARIIVGDAREALRQLPDNSVHCCVTSPPYWGLRSYLPADHPDKAKEIGLEASPEAFTASLAAVFAEVHRVIRPDGTLWLNLGDSYATGAGSAGNSPGGGQQGAKWAGDVDRIRDDKRGYRGERLPNGRGDQPSIHRVKTRATRDGTHAGKHTAIAAMGAMTQPNRMPIAGLKPKDLIGVPWRMAFALQGFAVTPFRSFAAWADELQEARRAGDWTGVEIVEAKLRAIGTLAALQARGWWLRSDCIWAKPNPMPESTRDRPTKAHEHVFLLTKAEHYFYDDFAVRQPYAESTLPQKGRPYGGVATKDYVQGRAQDPSDTKRRVVESLERRGGANLRTVWNIATQPFAGAHFATFPKALADRCILAGTSAHGCCASCGAPWERVVEKRLARTPAACNVGVVDERDENADANDQGSNRQRDGHVPGLVRADVEMGWKPTCDCQGAGLGVQPCTVLDPFTGAGTTGLAAALLGRSFVGCELNPAFAEMARKRIAAELPLFVRPRVAGGSA
jgi:DNA modification methylase